MKVVKNISDELWLGLVFLLVAVWMFALNKEYLIISGIFAFVGIILLIVDNMKKTNISADKEQDLEKEKVVKTVTKKINKK